MRSLGVCFAVVFLVSTTALSGCSMAVGCDFREVEDGLNNGPEDRCQERTGLQAVSFGPACSALSAKVVEGGCPTEGIVFGCQQNADVVDWHYAPTTRDQAEQECRSQTILDPP